MLYIYNPINNTKQKTTWELLSGITGKDISNLRCYKSRNKKVSNINSYIIDDKTTSEQLNKFMQRENPKNEIWKQISDGSYYISNYGRIKRIYKNGKQKILMPYMKHRKRLFIKVKIKGILTEKPIHKLVAEYFIENKNGYYCVRHKNEDLLDNHADNLEWIEKERLSRITAYKSKSIPVLKIDVNTNEIIDEYKSMADAGRKNYLHRETIRQCVRGEIKTAGGFKWIIDNEYGREVMI